VTQILLSAVVCLGVIAAIAGLFPIIARLRVSPGTRIHERMEREFGQTHTSEALPAFKDLHKPTVGPMSDGAPSIRERFATMVEHSGVEMAPAKLWRIVVLCAIGFGATAGYVKRNAFAVTGGAAVGAILPVLYIRKRAMKRDEKLLAQLPEILDLTARFLKAGHSLGQALGTVVEELKAPARELFARYVRQRDLGLPLEVTLRELADRAGLTEYRIMTMAILVQQQTGGNLTEVCERLATVVRERFRVQGMIRGLTAEGRLQAAILIALSPALVVIMTLVKPSYADAMLSQPKLIAGILVSQLIGILWIRKIVSVKF